MGAEVARQHDPLVCREAVGESGEPVRVGAPERVQRLVVVADAAEISIRAREQRDQHCLGLAGVLVFVDHDPAPPSAVELEVVRVFCQQPDRADEQVVEVHGV